MWGWRVRLWRRTVENYLVVNSRANQNVLSLCRLTFLKRSLKKCFPAQKMSFTAYQSGNNRQERRKFYYFKDIFVTTLFVSVSDREKGVSCMFNCFVSALLGASIFVQMIRQFCLVASWVVSVVIWSCYTTPFIHRLNSVYSNKRNTDRYLVKGWWRH